MWEHFFKTEKKLLNPYIEKLNEYPGFICYETDKLKSRKGSWNRHFIKNSPLHVEIGSGNGNHAVRQAEIHKNINYIACELRFKRLVVSAKKSEKRKLTNVQFIRMYAQELESVFGVNEIDRLYIYFPEPWDDESHEKREKKRVLSATIIESYKKILKTDGEIWFKTDHDGYFEDIKRAFENRGDFEMLEIEYDFQTPFSEQTEFEQLFLKKGIKIKRMILKKRG
ncbi:MAG: tRNA (guanosine(46)-N7)-methyltransferase TrmB [Fusobacteria bacterium]|nr:tRNA (guanosine(46)-N7)-methyltransferase TrmB [Fusobacteriota bacterium]